MLDWIEVPTVLVTNPIVSKAVPGVPFIVPVANRKRIHKGRIVVAVRIDPDDHDTIRLYHKEPLDTET